MFVNTFSMIDFIRKFHDEACETLSSSLAIWADLHSVRLFSCLSLTYSTGFPVFTVFRQVSLTAGTIIEHCKISRTKWFRNSIE